MDPRQNNASDDDSGDVIPGYEHIGYQHLPLNGDVYDSSSEDESGSDIEAGIEVNQYRPLADVPLSHSNDNVSSEAAQEMLTDSPASLSNDALVASIRAQGLIPEREPVEPLQAFADDFELPEDNIGEIQRAMQEISMTLKPPAWLLK
eukprot:TRINITY_DN12598_c0_g6_i2.p1 TRINITY_DN12598_c0_g6~~TRINITY_DN12598_c0_g6_i2.p1  ORF type:complete len:158 (+),score=23.33 TRINITY_DN12598_c0_g6_i2:32-475(+)